MESLTKLVSIGFLLYQWIFEFCKEGNSQNYPLKSNTLKSVPTLSPKKNSGPLYQPTSGAPTLAARIWRLDVSLFKKSAAAAAAAAA